MLRYVNHFSTDILQELFIDFDEFLEVQLLEVYIHPSNEKIDEISLFEPVVSQTAKGLQHFGKLLIEVIECLQFL